MDSSGNSKKSTINEVLKIFNNGWNKQVILYGPPGTSKTYSSTIIAAAMLAGVEKNNNEYNEDSIKEAIKGKLEALKGVDLKVLENINNYSTYALASLYLKFCKNYKLVQFHPSYSYEDFVRGITVRPGDNNNITYEVESKIIEKFCLENEGSKKVLVIDEINRAPLASVLGELIYGLEYRGEKISTPYELKKSRTNEDNNGNQERQSGTDAPKETEDLIIPEDLYIIGTMNTADRSIGSMDYAVRRRFAFIPVESKRDAIVSSWASKTVGEYAANLYDALMDEKTGIFAKDKYLVDTELDVNDIKIGHTYFLGRKEDTEEADAMAYLEYRIEYQIKPIYKEYIKDGMIEKAGEDELNKILREKKWQVKKETPENSNRNVDGQS